MMAPRRHDDERNGQARDRKSKANGKAHDRKSEANGKVGDRKSEALGKVGRTPVSEPTVGVPPDAHEWVSFADEELDRTWTFDVTFLTSRWTCVFGAGCQGVLTGPAEEMAQGCCSYGAHFTDDADVERVRAAARTLTDEEWQHRPARPGTAIRTEADGTRVTRLVDDACIFLNRPDFAAGPGCALHLAAVRRGQLPLELKPDVCWQLPLRREEHVDDHGHVTSVITQWDRRHWGEGGSSFHWWCTEAPEAFTAEEAVYRTLGAELVAMVGPVTYLRLVAYLDARRLDGSRALPHPAVRRK